MDDPIRLPLSRFKRGPDQKIKRGGTGKLSYSGTARRIRTPIRANRNFKKPSKKGGGEYQQIPWPARAPFVWDPNHVA